MAQCAINSMDDYKIERLLEQVVDELSRCADALEDIHTVLKQPQYSTNDGALEVKVIK